MNIGTERLIITEFDISMAEARPFVYPIILKNGKKNASNTTRLDQSVFKKDGVLVLSEVIYKR